MSASDGSESDSAATKRPFHYRFLKKQRHRANKIIASSSLISNAPVLDSDSFDWTSELALHWQAIRDEALAIFRHKQAIPPLREISPDHRRIMRDNSWRSFFLVGYGNLIAKNMARAPITSRLVQSIPALNSAFFSILAPGAVIVPHRGVSKAIITAHLGLTVPQEGEKCWMRVHDQKLHWREGEWTVFDDTYEHEVRNETDETRIVLLCQIVRPLRAPGSWLAKATLDYVRRSGFVQDAKNNLADWETVYAKAETEGL
ncbi:MAG: aspartyl/asparaginyl beta-hydroxylase domain-containing protein [Pseudomonadota bacterium]